MFANLKKQITIFLDSQPQVKALLNKFNLFWQTYGRHIRIICLSLFIAIFITIAIGFGRKLAILNRPTDNQPASLPTVAPSPETAKISVFTDLKQQISDFSPLLPDPAPPAVDGNITLQSPKK